MGTAKRGTADAPQSPRFENGAQREGRTGAGEWPSRGEIGRCAASAAQAVERALRKHGRGALKQVTDTGKRQDE